MFCAKLHTQASRLHIGGRESAVKIRVRELTDGQKFYGHELIKHRPTDLADSPGTSGEATKGHLAGSADEPSASQKQAITGGCVRQNQAFGLSAGRGA